MFPLYIFILFYFDIMSMFYFFKTSKYICIIYTSHSRNLGIRKQRMGIGNKKLVFRATSKIMSNSATHVALGKARIQALLHFSFWGHETGISCWCHYILN